MITNSVEICIKSVDEAPNYNEIPEKFTPITVKKVIVVKKGMVSGRPTYDFQCEDAKGNKYLIMLTGGIFETISGFCKNKKG